LRETIGHDGYNALISNQKGEDLLHRWLNASRKTKPVATKALALHIARIAKRADLVGRIEHEIGEVFEIEKPKKSIARKKASPLRDLAKGDDASGYIKARQSSRH
jgi:hypothetical protein